jgi:hypothetical protein
VIPLPSLLTPQSKKKLLDTAESKVKDVEAELAQSKKALEDQKRKSAEEVARLKEDNTRLSVNVASLEVLFFYLFCLFCFCFSNFLSFVRS